MKLTTGILVLLMAGGAWAQNPIIIQNTRDSMNAVQEKKVADSNAALGTAPSPANLAPSTPAVTAAPAKPAPGKAAAAKPAASQTAASKPAASKPAASQTAASKPAASKPAATSATPAPKSSATPAGASASGKGAAVANMAAASQPAAKKAAKQPVAVIVPKTAKKGKKEQPKSVVRAQSAAPAKPEEKEKKYAMTGKRDPFLSPVVSHMGGSSCNTGKKCLEIGQINLKGVVKSDAGMIAVVTNSMNKAYFLRENDPVFNGYVEKITGDSITFKETFQDKVGKSFTRDVVKKILTPAV